MAILLFHLRSKDPKINAKLHEPYMKAILIIYSFVLPAFLAVGTDKLFFGDTYYYLLCGVYMLLLNLLLFLRRTRIDLFGIPLWIFSFVIMFLQRF